MANCQRQLSFGCDATQQYIYYTERTILLKESKILAGYRSEK